MKQEFSFFFSKLILEICLMDSGSLLYSLMPALCVLLSDKLVDTEGGWRLFLCLVLYLCILELI